MTARSASASACSHWNVSFPVSVATHREIIERDEQWHDLLTSACPNGRLLSLLASIKNAVHLYEFEMVPSDALIERVAAENGLDADELIAEAEALIAEHQERVRR